MPSIRDIFVHLSAVDDGLIDMLTQVEEVAGTAESELQSLLDRINEIGQARIAIPEIDVRVQEPMASAEEPVGLERFFQPELEAEQIQVELGEVPVIEVGEAPTIEPVEVEIGELPPVEISEIGEIPPLEVPEIAIQPPEMPPVGVELPEIPPVGVEVPEIAIQPPEMPPIGVELPEIPPLEAPEIAIQPPEMPPVGVELPEIPTAEMVTPEVPPVELETTTIELSGHEELRESMIRLSEVMEEFSQIEPTGEEPVPFVERGYLGVAGREITEAEGVLREVSTERVERAETNLAEILDSVGERMEKVRTGEGIEESRVDVERWTSRIESLLGRVSEETGITIGEPVGAGETNIEAPITVEFSPTIELKLDSLDEDLRPHIEDLKRHIMDQMKREMDVKLFDIFRSGTR